MNTRNTLSGLGFAILFAGSAGAQNLYAAPVVDSESVVESAADDPGSLASLSLMYVKPPEPREIKKHDIISILVDENSSVTAEQTLETKKKLTTKATLNTILDPWELLEMRLRTGAISNLDLLDATANNKYTGDGEYERTDKFTARIAATVLEVKPNGTLVLEARKRITKDDEEQVMVLSGRIRKEDVTKQNTILSSQIAELTLVMHNTGEVSNAAEKGLITRVLDAIFSF